MMPKKISMLWVVYPLFKLLVEKKIKRHCLKHSAGARVSMLICMDSSLKISTDVIIEQMDQIKCP